MATQQEITVAGTVKKIRYVSPDGTFSIIQIGADKQHQQAPCCDSYGNFTTKGSFPGVKVGHRLEVTGTAESDKKFGPQLKAGSFREVDPDGNDAIAKYLAANVDLIGPQYARKIVALFGKDTFKILDETPERLNEIGGVGPKRIESIIKLWQEQRGIRKVLEFFTHIGVSAKFAAKFWDAYGDQTIATIQADPYRLARDVDGIGFKKADEYASKMGIPEQSPQRITAAIEYMLEESQKAGNCFEYGHTLVGNVIKLLGNAKLINQGLVQTVLVEAVRRNLLIAEDDRIYLPATHAAEQFVANKLRTMLAMPMPAIAASETVKTLASDAIAKLPFELAESQKDAVQKSVTSKVSVLTGGPGTGKCLGKGTPILMFDGTIKNVEDVQIGDQLMGPDSTPRNVLSLARGREDMFRVRPNKGDPYVVNRSHILSLKHKGEIVNISVADYLDESKKFREKAKGWRTGVEFSHKLPDIDPYFLGLWLGDGASAGPTIFTTDSEIVSYLTVFARNMGLELLLGQQAEGKCPRYNITTGVRGGGPAVKGSNRVLTILQNLNVINNKHIPHRFKANTSENRLKLLAGLIDSDGYYDANGNGYEFSSANHKLAEDVIHVARSLGFAAYGRRTFKMCQTGAGCDCTVVYISGDVDRIPVKIYRKKARPRIAKKNVLHTGITLELLGEGDYYGFEIDGDRLFLLGDFTVTHNTSITKVIVEVFHKASLPITLLAPTGRAGKRMGEVIGMPAATIHKHLFILDKLVREGHMSREGAMIDGVVFVDESSMVDIKLAKWLLSYIRDTAILIIIGDKDQLPSVGPGSFLRDLIDCGVIPVSQLTHIFRQAKGSNICVAAAQINSGQMPMMPMLGQGHPFPDSDFMVVLKDDAEDQQKAALWCATTLAQHFGYNPTRDCQVLCPMRKGEAGVDRLNAELQQVLNPNPTVSVDRGFGVRWGVGDKVMQLKNNYGLGVLNGDIGTIIGIDLTDENRLERLTVDFDGQQVVYESHKDWEGLTLSYSCTIHKMQGSEFPFVVMLVHTSHFTLLQRNLIYTGLTRGKKHVVLIASSQALNMAVRNNTVAKRNSYLAEKLRGKTA